MTTACVAVYRIPCQIPHHTPGHTGRDLDYHGLFPHPPREAPGPHNFLNYRVVLREPSSPSKVIHWEAYEEVEDNILPCSNNPSTMDMTFNIGISTSKRLQKPPRSFRWSLAWIWRLLEDKRKDGYLAWTFRTSRAGRSPLPRGCQSVKHRNKICRHFTLKSIKPKVQQQLHDTRFVYLLQCASLSRQISPTHLASPLRSPEYKNHYHKQSWHTIMASFTSLAVELRTEIIIHALPTHLHDSCTLAEMPIPSRMRNTRLKEFEKRARTIVLASPSAANIVSHICEQHHKQRAKRFYLVSSLRHKLVVNRGT
jgi:hypothetical protein